MRKVIAYISGHYAPVIDHLTYYIYMRDDQGNSYKLDGKITDEDTKQHKQIAAELIAAITATKKAIELGYEQIELCYRFNGVQYFFTGYWRTKSDFSYNYKNTMYKLSKKIDITFRKATKSDVNPMKEIVNVNNWLNIRR